MAGRTKGKWVRRNEREWRGLLSRFEGCGLGVEAFCRRESISAASFYRWRTLLSTAGAEAVGGELAPAFVDLGPLNTVASSGRRLEIKLDLGDGLVLHLVKS
jgi:hypothetical protein